MRNYKPTVGQEYARYYESKNYDKIYPSEFVVRTLMANYPELKLKKPEKGDTVIDISCGYGRNLLFLCEQGYNVYATEAAQEICDATSQRMMQFGYTPEILLGKNHNLPFKSGFADYILAAYCSYYCDDDIVMDDNIKEYARVLKDGGWLVTCIIHKDAEYLKGSQSQGDGTYIITNRSNGYTELVGYRVYAPESLEQLITDFSPYFTDFSFGEENNNFYGVKLRAIWMVCRKK